MSRAEVLSDLAAVNGIVKISAGVPSAIQSGTDVKTINSATLLGSGDISVQVPLVSGSNIKTINSTSLLGSGDITAQAVLVSGDNIKTVGNQSLLGSGNVDIYTRAKMFFLRG